MVVVMLIAALVATSPPSPDPDTAPTATTTPPTASAVMARLPLSFEANHGQSDPSVHYITRAKGYTAFFTDQEAVLVLSGPKERPEADSPASVRGRIDPPGTGETDAPEKSVIRISFADANPAPTVTGEGIQEGKTNYLTGNDPAGWRREIPNYSSIRYGDLWPGIDLVFYDSSERTLAYDLIVAPGADPSKIRFEVTGMDALEVTDSGALVVKVPTGEITKSAPYIYQADGDHRRGVVGGFELLGEDRFGFAIGDYDTSRPLVIDPTLTYSTYLGGSGGDAGYGIAVDSSGAAYVTGSTHSTDFPTASPIQGSNAGGSDAFVTKVNAAGSALVYSTYLGGSGTDSGYGIAIDSSGAAYVTGQTSSTDFPTASPIQGSNAGSWDAFVTKVNAAGSALVYSTYLGGSSDDFGRGIAVDFSGAAYVTGQTYSTDFPTASPIQGSKAATFSDAFVTKVNAAGSALVYSTYLGGSSDDDFGRGIAVDSSGAAYVTGQTRSTDFPTASPIQGSIAGGPDAFVTKVNAAGSALVYSTYLGGMGVDIGYGIAVDSSGAAYVTGHTYSINFPTASPIQGSIAGFPDAFVTKVNAAGSALAYSTYLGGSSDDFGRGIAVDSSGAAYVTGQTRSTDFPIASPIQGSNAGSWDAFVTKVNAAGSALAYSTYLGGSSDDFGRGIAVDSSGAAYVTGETWSTDFPTSSPIQGSNAGAPDAFVTKIQDIVTISGTFVGGQHGAISVYSTSGSHVAYFCCMTTDSWSIQVPAFTCPAGYKVLWLPPNDSKKPTWFDNKSSYSAADCVSAPSSSNDMTLTAAANLEGYVKDFDTAADIDGAIAYAFDSTTGSFVGWSRSGSAGPGRFRIGVTSPGDYKVRVVPPAGHVGGWYDGRTNYTEASPIAAPSTEVNFSLRGSGVIDGYVKSATTAEDLNGYPVYAYTEAGVFFGYGVTDRGYGPGRYRIEADPGTPYKLLAGGGGGFSSQWYSGSANFGVATATAAPFTANFSLS